MKFIRLLFLLLITISVTYGMSISSNINETKAHASKYELKWPSSTAYIKDKFYIPEVVKPNQNNNYANNFLIFLLLFVASVVYANYYIHNHYSQEAANDLVGFPIQTFNAIFVFFLIYQLEFTSQQSQKLQEKSLARNLSLFTQQVVVDRWENEAMENPELDELYESIFSRSNGDINGFYSKEKWEQLNIPVEYVPYHGNETQWHYSAKFLQELVNIVRMFELEKKFQINNMSDLKKSTEGKFAGWITAFRMYLKEPIVRNVWEQYKYKHVNPEFSAWVKFYITDIIDNDPLFFQKHKDKWESSMNKVLKKSPNQ